MPAVAPYPVASLLSRFVLLHVNVFVFRVPITFSVSRTPRYVIVCSSPSLCSYVSYVMCLMCTCVGVCS